MLRRRYQRFKSARASCSTMRSEAEILSWGAPAENMWILFSCIWSQCLEALFAAGFTKLERFPFAPKSRNLFFRKFRNIKTTGSQKWRTKHCLFTENARNLIGNFQTVGCWSLYSDEWIHASVASLPLGDYIYQLLVSHCFLSTLNIAVSR